MEDLFQNLSLKLLARRIGGAELQDDGSAITVRPGDDTIPVFFVPTGFGDHSYVFELAHHIDAQLPLYVLPWPRGQNALPKTIESMAERMAGMVRQVQPSGPYRIAGYSYGGILAYAIASYLISIDETVSFVGLIDCRLPSGNSGELIDTKRMVVNYVTDRSTPDKIHLAKVLRRSSDQLTLHQLIVKGQELGLLSSDHEASTERLIWEQRQEFDHLIRAYQIPEISVNVFQFYALKESPSSHDTDVGHMGGHPKCSPLGGWENVLELSSITLVPIPGDHLTMMTDSANRKVLGDAISKAVSSSISVEGPRPDDFDPLIPLTAPNYREAPMFCIPGAGSSVTGFIEVVCELATTLPVFGLQPRGISKGQQPHGTVEAAAAYYLKAIDKSSGSGSLHLLGHSFGGLVAFEMACRLQASGRTVGMLTIIDSEPPGLERDVTDVEAFREFVEAIKLTFDCPLSTEETTTTGADVRSKIRALHAAMVKSGLLPSRSHSDELLGPFTTFATALRTKYHPSMKFNGTLRLVQVRDPTLTPRIDTATNSAFAAQWSRFATVVDIWQGPGHHFSILRKPHVSSLVDWLGLARNAPPGGTNR
ncbi:MAG TPA: hypothetical protein DDW73_14925 [Rhizobium sp.]|nr:hypothetical protein [Rhizobium sp.]